MVSFLYVGDRRLMLSGKSRFIQLGLALGAIVWIASCAAFMRIQREGVSFFTAWTRSESKSEAEDVTSDQAEGEVTESETLEDTFSPVEIVELTAEEHFQSAIDAFESDHPEEAREHFNKALERLSEKELSLETHFELATLYLTRVNGNGNGNGHDAIELVNPDTVEPGRPDFSETFSIPENLPTVEAIIDSVTKGDREGFQAGLDRMAFYQEEIRRLIQEEDMPEELVILPLVESSYDIRTTSRRGARGLWQFMPSTARKYRLNQNPKDRAYLEERLDLDKSTRAAMRYLRDLYNLFGSWELALSGYNWGERNVSEMMLKHYSRDYWNIRGAPSKTFPKETRRYIDKVYAFALIARDPEKYGFEIGRSPFPPTEQITVKPEHGDLNEIARECLRDPEVLRLLNPELTLGRTPPAHEEYTIAIPRGTRVLFEVALAENRIGRRPLSEGVHNYVIRRGDTLISIAKRYGTSVQAIRDANGLRGHLIIAGKTLQIPIN